jgi:hypothetical protein
MIPGCRAATPPAAALARARPRAGRGAGYARAPNHQDDGPGVHPLPALLPPPHRGARDAAAPDRAGPAAGAAICRFGAATGVPILLALRPGDGGSGHGRGRGG